MMQKFSGIAEESASVLLRAGNEVEAPAAAVLAVSHACGPTARTWALPHRQKLLQLYEGSDAPSG